MKKVLVVADTKGWAFDKIYKGLHKNCAEWDVEVSYLYHPRAINFKNYNLILYLCDNFPNPLIQWINQGLVPKEKVMLAVRSHVTHPLYNHANLLDEICTTLVVSNESLFKRFKDMHPRVRLASGGVDTDIYTYKERNWDLHASTIRVGWSGSIGVFNREFRGLDIIEEACKDCGFAFNPAISQDRMRTEEEMVTYYRDEIDIFVEMSKSTGRSNGLVESGSCGVPVISYNSGIAEQLIGINNKNGVLLQERTFELLSVGLSVVLNNYDEYSKNIRKEIEKNWSWKHHATIFETIFNDVL